MKSIAGRPTLTVVKFGFGLRTKGLGLEVAPHIGHNAAYEFLQEFAREDRENGTSLEEL